MQSEEVDKAPEQPLGKGLSHLMTGCGTTTSQHPAHEGVAQGQGRGVVESPQSVSGPSAAALF